MQVVSFYENIFERQFARRLRLSVKAQGLDCELVRPPGGAGPKPRTRSAFLGRRFADGLKDDLLLVDPDALMTERPAILLEETDFDLAVYYTQETLTISGPLYVRNNARAGRLVAEWIRLAAQSPERSETELLSQLLSNAQGRWNVRRLPVTYAWVERIDRERHPGARPVITHFKADSLSNRIRIPG